METTPLSTINNDQRPKIYRNAETPQSNFGNHLQKELEIAFEVIWKNRQVYHQVSDQQVHQYKQADQVMLYNNQLSRINKPRKLSLDWNGPLVIKEVLSETRLNLKGINNEKKHTDAHISMFKPYYQNSN